MKVVNLSGRPFVNRRPLVRLGIILWVLGGLLVLVNLALFQSYWSDSRDVREELADAEEQVAVELLELEALDQQIDRVNLTQQNSQAAYLNSLISYRTFPWSALFDDLERVMPMDVRLQSVTPAVKLAAAEALERVERDARRQQVEQRRNRRSRRSSRSSSAASNAGATADDPTLSQDEVQLQIQGVAKNEDALIEFLDTLYQDKAFRLPVLSGERFDNIGGQLNSSFQISVIYLTGDRLSEAADTADSADDDSESAPDGDNAEGADTEAVEVDGPESGEEIVAASGDVAAPEAPMPTAQTQQAATPPAAPPPAASPPPPRTEPVRSEPSQEPRRSSSRTAQAEDGASAPSASESAAEARRRRIEELRQRRRDAIRRSRARSAGGASARDTTSVGRPTSRGNDGVADRGSQPSTRGETSRDRNTDSETPSASQTPRIRGSLVPGLPELLERVWPRSPSPFEEAWEELG